MSKLQMRSLVLGKNYGLPYALNNAYVPGQQGIQCACRASMCVDVSSGKVLDRHKSDLQVSIHGVSFYSGNDDLASD